MKFNKTVLGVLVFVILLIAAGYSAKVSSEENGARVSLGTTIINSTLQVGEIGYEHNNWEASAALMKGGDTVHGDQDQLEIYSVSYLTKPNWGYKGVNPYFRLGVSYNSGSTLVGDSNYRLGFGLDFHNVWRAEFSHYSSAGIHDINRGIDMLTLTYKIQPPF